ncbi:MAG: starch-binding protein [Muribaculaceae bacterium]|nr:starch-binding protein [Muribaculaceae bacterium]
MNKTLGSALLTLLCAAAGTGMLHAADYGLPEGIQEGNILHCFNWTASEIKAELPKIAEAGFGSVQMSPMQRPDIKSGSSWHDLYRPYDLAFKSSSYCSEQDLKDLCAEAAKYGIKIIVDVVANHVDRTAGYHDTWWDSNGRVRWDGNINYGDRYSITHGQLGDYGDVNSESSEVQARGKAYVEKLKEMGVSGIRWDAAKHIGLPSEGCDFWSTVTSVPGMYHYGEILDSPGPDASIIKEYAQYMSVTDNKYCNYAARDNGGIPGGYGGDWVVNQGLSDTKLVYWAESHDTYSNDEWSQNVDQSVIDRAYAAYACRSGATALYLARPNAVGFNNIKVGKGSTAYQSKSVAEVNKFRNAMTGKKDWFESNGNACSITRENGGAVIVMKGSGNVSITNGGGYCPAGTYTDRVSGGVFTVTATTISGNVGSSGIAVIYDGEVDIPTPPDPTPGPTPTPTDGYYVYFDNTANWSKVMVWAWNSTENCVAASEWPGDQMTAKDGVLYWSAPAGKVPTEIIFSNNGGDKAGGGDLTFVNGATYYPDGTYKMISYGGGDDDDDDPVPGPQPVDMPSALYVLGNISGAQWDTANGAAMHVAETGVFATTSKVTFTPAAGESVCYFNLTDRLGADWDEVNMNANRFGPATEGVTLTLNNWGDMKKYTNNVDASACKSWTVTPGSYYVRADFNNGRVQITDTTGVEILTSDDDSEAAYFTLQGVRVAEPETGRIYIRVSGGKATKVMMK